jgi:hypothetical protein
MRLWSLHPKHLDRSGLLALWREGLLAQKVLAGKTRGYRHHPQLDRFKAHPSPQDAIAYYLWIVQEEGQRRGYAFRADRIVSPKPSRIRQIPVSSGQIAFERARLQGKLRLRDVQAARALGRCRAVEPHSLFSICPGDVEPWEKGEA